MNKGGIQAQLASDAFRTLVRSTWPYTLKVLDGARDRELVGAWATARRSGGGGGLLMLRLVTSDTAPLDDLAADTDRALRAFDGWQAFFAGGVRVVLEVPRNERDHTEPREFARLAAATVPVAERIRAAGFLPGVLITSEGNPPGDDFGAPFFLQPDVLDCMRRFRQLGAVWCPHGYSHPPAAPDDPWHFARPAHILARLPSDARLNFALGELGCDGGCDLPDRRDGVGWRGYFGDGQGRVARYRDFVRAQIAWMAAQPLCVGGAVFLSGADPAGRPNFESFDVGDEVDFRACLREDVPGLAPTWLGPNDARDPAPAPPVVVAPPAPTPTPTPRGGAMRIGMLYRMGSDIPEQSGRAIVNLWKSGGLLDVCPKAADGDALEGEFDRSPLAINTLDDVANQTAYYRSQGLEYVPWVVPRGADPAAEGDLHGRIAKLTGAVLVDWEWQYRGFFDRGDWSAALTYFETLRRAAAGAQIIFNPDPRQLAWGAQASRSIYDFSALRPFVDAYAPQVYWTDFQSPWEGVLVQGVPVGLGMPVYPMLPANATPDDLTAAIGWLAARGIGRVYLFQRASLRAGVLERTVGLATPELVAPAPSAPAEPTYPNGRRIPSDAEYDQNVWTLIQQAANALMNGGDGDGDDTDARTLLALKQLNERRHGVTR